jgi:hypothetical protein
LRAPVDIVLAALAYESFMGDYDAEVRRLNQEDAP